MTGLREVVLASTRPVSIMALLLFGVAAAAGWLAGDMSSALGAAGWGLLVGVSGLWAHETAHLTTARRLAGSGAAEVIASGSTLAVRAPNLEPAHALTVALVGPVVGAVVSLAWLAGPAHWWIAWGFALVHIVNLVPVGGTDGALAWRAGCRLLTRRWSEQRGVTGGQ